MAWQPFFSPKNISIVALLVTQKLLGATQTCAAPHVLARLRVPVHGGRGRPPRPREN